jgi:thiamine-phosphate pyrophosphorylase
MVILISSENNFTGELDLVNDLFKAGMQVFHLRKPGLNTQELKEYLNGIRPIFLKKVVIHQCYELLTEFSLKGIHIKDSIDSLNSARVLRKLKLDSNSWSWSRSFHEIDSLINCGDDYDYCFLSPVFSSISKPDYKGRYFKVHGISKKIIALGGVNSSNISLVRNMGYDGIALLGAVWNSVDPINEFNKMKNQFELCL